jgi:hypothetical protein
LFFKAECAPHASGGFDKYIKKINGASRADTLADFSKA